MHAVAFPEMSKGIEMNNYIKGSFKLFKLPSVMLVSPEQLDKGVRVVLESGALACVSLPKSEWLANPQQKELLSLMQGLRTLAEEVPRGKGKPAVSAANKGLPGFVSSGLKADYVSCTAQPLPNRLPSTVVVAHACQS